MESLPAISVVINTDGRCQALANTLDSLRYLDYPSFEVCVVPGPTEDGTRELLAKLQGQIKVAACPVRNLSISRNIGISLAAGGLVAFLDDDCLAEPEWLGDLEEAFRDPAVGGAGGIVYDHTGVRPQYLYSSANRLGQADCARTRPADEFNFPFSFNFPYVQGTNCIFRRDALISVGGFDEEYEFYLDETDLCCRLVDADFLVRQMPNARVHHKFLPSEIRNEQRITRRRYAVVKNKIYFSIINNRGHYGLNRVVRDAVNFIEDHERDIRDHVEYGRLLPDDLSVFQADVDLAWETGMRRGLSGSRRLLRAETLQTYGADYLEYPRPYPKDGRHTFCLISPEYPPGKMGGLGRYLHRLAHSMALLGHHVHILTDGTGHDRVDFEDSVWVHRIVPRSFQVPELPDGKRIPQRIWEHSAPMLAEVEAIAKNRTVDCVYAPTWDCEGATLLQDGRFPLVTGLQTTLDSWLSSQPHQQAANLLSRAAHYAGVPICRKAAELDLR
jgi:GT2 family glycosyltransferase